MASTHSVAVVGAHVEPGGVGGVGREHEPRVIDAERAHVEPAELVHAGLFEKLGHRSDSSNHSLVANQPHLERFFS